MQSTFTEKTHPIRIIWIFKKTFVTGLPFLIIMVFYLVFGMSGPNQPIPTLDKMVSIVIPFSVIFSAPIVLKALRRAYFRFALEDAYIVIHQGIIAKNNKNIPYAKIQGVYVNQSVFDRVFGLASVTFENFSEGGGSDMNVRGYAGNTGSTYEVLGFLGNKVNIPGLQKTDAEEIKKAILEKMKVFSTSDNHSGL